MSCDKFGCAKFFAVGGKAATAAVEKAAGEKVST